MPGLGASRRNIFGLVLGQSLRLVIMGMAVGVMTSLVLTRMFEAFLYGTAAADPMTFLTVGAVLVVMALLAGYVSARRAPSIDPSPVVPAIPVKQGRNREFRPPYLI